MSTQVHLVVTRDLCGAESPDKVLQVLQGETVETAIQRVYDKAHDFGNGMFKATVEGYENAYLYDDTYTQITI